VRDMVEEKKVLLEKVDTLKNVADALTKAEIEYESESESEKRQMNLNLNLKKGRN
jgi:hypothetical protein